MVGLIPSMLTRKHLKLLKETINLVPFEHFIYSRPWYMCYQDHLYICKTFVVVDSTYKI